MARTPRHKGRHTTKRPGMRHVADLSDTDGTRWAFYMWPTNEEGWGMIKLAAHGVVKRKANFWMGWNGERLARTTDAAALAYRRPHLHAALMELLQGPPPAPTTEPDPDGYDLI